MIHSKIALGLLATLAIAVSPALAVVATPTVTGPITGPGTPFGATTMYDLTPFGYMEEEYFLEGTASAYVGVGALPADGKWSATTAGTADYRTRILVFRPISKRKFNGTVVVEWLNVSGGVDAAPDWVFAHTQAIREGFAWICLSAQKVGIDGGPSPIGAPLALKQQNPARYGTLLHPGDTYSYDMFSQAGVVARNTTPVKVLGPLKPKRVIAIGESQSAFRMVTYVNAIHPLTQVYDGFLIHSRGGGGANLSQTPQPNVSVPSPAPIRDDIDVPVLTFETETDLFGLGFFPARQDDGKLFRLWEVAGTAHADSYQLFNGPTDMGKGAHDTTYDPPVTSVFGFINCAKPVNAGPQHYVLAAAVSQLNRWVRTGKAAPRAPRLEVDTATNSIKRDAHGNALGGIRTAQVDAPIQSLTGVAAGGGDPFCSLFGGTVPFDAATLAGLYPTHKAYVAAVTKATNAAVHGGFVLRPDAKAIKAAAAASTIGN